MALIVDMDERFHCADNLVIVVILVNQAAFEELSDAKKALCSSSFVVSDGILHLPTYAVSVAFPVMYRPLSLCLHKTYRMFGWE